MDLDLYRIKNSEKYKDVFEPWECLLSDSNNECTCLKCRLNILRENTKEMITWENDTNFDSARWDVWLISDSINENGKNDELVFWELWYTLVHQNWYGRDIKDKVPSCEWLWERCLYAFIYSKKVQCHFWPETKGALVLTTKRVIYNKFTNEEDIQNVKTWVHQSWVNNIPDAWLEGEDDKTLYIQIEREHDNPKCSICKKNEGTWLTCDYKDWKYSFHVTWAQKKGIIKDDMEPCTIDGPEPITKFFWLKHYSIGTKLIKSNRIKELEPTAKEPKKRKMKKKHLEKLQKLQEKAKYSIKKTEKQRILSSSENSTQSKTISERKISPVFLKAK